MNTRRAPDGNLYSLEEFVEWWGLQFGNEMWDQAAGAAGAEEPGAEHGVASRGPGAGVEEPVVGAVEPSGRPPLSAVLEAAQSQVPTSAERDRVLDAGRHLASGPNKKVVRSLAGK